MRREIRCGVELNERRPSLSVVLKTMQTARQNMAYHSHDRRQSRYRGYDIAMERRDLCWTVRMKPSSPELPKVEQRSFKTATQSSREALKQAKRKVDRALRSAASATFEQVLHASGPDRDREAKLALYAWLVGSWDMEVTTHLEDGSAHVGRGEIHAGWVLQGRAIQDVWMIPRFKEQKPGVTPLPGSGNWYGTTLRIYDPNLGAWRILWNDPATDFFTQQIGRARGRDIVQEGPDPRGGTMRWTFSEIRSDSFRWQAERAPDQENWLLEVDICARRTA
jgi:hypothetical protein